MLDRVAVLGAGSWGTALASSLSKRTAVALWARRREIADLINETHRNPAYLPEIVLSSELRATSSIDEAVDGADVVVMAVPAAQFREVLRQAVQASEVTDGIVNVAKGLEQQSRCRMSEVTADVAPAAEYAVLTGPNIAREIASGLPAYAVMASADQDFADSMASLFSLPNYTIETSSDVVGCEIAGAVKNAMAIAVGLVDGRGLGDNATAAVITRCLGELISVGVALGGDLGTLFGPAGIGDLVVTCTSEQSRNHHVGRRLGEGAQLHEIRREMHMVAEGIDSARAVLDLAEAHGIEMPVVGVVVEVLDGRISARIAGERLVAGASHSPDDNRISDELS